MSIDVSNNLNSAVASAMAGLQRSSDGITQAAVNIAQANASAPDTETLLANAATQQLSAIDKIMPAGGDTLTNDLVSLSVNSINAQASAKVLDVVNDTVGTLINETA